MNQQERFQAALDDYMNLLLNKPTTNDILQLETDLNNRGITNKQIDQIKGKCIAFGIPVPKAKDDREKIVVQVGPKYEKMCVEIQLKDVLNQFGELIYGKKFNDGMFGAFGHAQNVNTDIRGKMIVLRLPRAFENFDTKINYSGMCSVCDLCMSLTLTDPRNKLKILLQKMQNSIRHVNNHDIKVKIEYV